MAESEKKSRSWRFGVYQVDVNGDGDASGAELQRNGTLVKIREQCLRILVHFVEHAGELVTREDLRRVLWPADTFVDFEQSLNAAMMKLRETLGDVADAPIYIETSPKRGYRFIAPVTQPVDRGTSNAGADKGASIAVPVAESVPGSAKAVAVAGESTNGSVNGSAKARAAGGFWIAVMPFKWTGTDNNLASCADGATEDIVTGLARFSYLRVLGASTMARYAGKPVESRDASEELGARYLLEGSLRQAGPRVRLAAQLVDCETGAHLWAETYDRAFCSAEEFELLDDIVPQVVSTIADSYGVLPRSMGETLRGAAASSLSPYEAVLRCFAYFQRLNAEEHLPVRTALETAVQQAPGYADAWAMLSLVYKEEFTQGFNLLPEPLDRALTAARRGVEIAPSNHLAHHALAVAEFFRKEYQRFRLAAARALELNPMDGFTLAYLGMLIAYSGDWKRGGVLSASARRLNPHHPGWYWLVPGMEAYRNGEYRAALEFADRVNMPGFWRTSLLIAAARGQMGDTAAGGRALEMLLMQCPEFAEGPEEVLSVWWQPGVVEQLMDGLYKAGLADRRG